MATRILKKQFIEYFGEVNEKYSVTKQIHGVYLGRNLLNEELYFLKIENLSTSYSLNDYPEKISHLHFKRERLKRSRYLFNHQASLNAEASVKLIIEEITILNLEKQMLEDLKDLKNITPTKNKLLKF